MLREHASWCLQVLEVHPSLDMALDGFLHVDEDGLFGS